MKTYFSEGKLTKQFGNPLSKNSPFNHPPLFLSNFSMTPLPPLCTNMEETMLKLGRLETMLLHSLGD